MGMKPWRGTFYGQRLNNKEEAIIEFNLLIIHIVHTPKITFVRTHDPINTDKNFRKSEKGL